MNPRMTPKDFFLHLGATVALFAAAIALLNLSFSVIDYAFPDELAGYFYANSVVWPISMLVVLAPLLYVLEWLLDRDLIRVPAKREIWVRRWRIFLTLFLTGATIVGDLIYLINNYLNGEISARFIYKVLVVLVVSATIFAYYAVTLGAVEKKKRLAKALAWVGIILALTVVVGGFVAVGSPGRQRDLRFDDERVGDLSNIQWQVVNYWQQKERLPAALSDLNDSISGFVAPTDPADHSSYEYAVKGENQFELCADFALKSVDPKGQGPYYPAARISYPAMPGNSDTWSHEAGRVCFERTIDPSKYPPILKSK